MQSHPIFRIVLVILIASAAAACSHPPHGMVLIPVMMLVGAIIWTYGWRRVPGWEENGGSLPASPV